MKRRDRTDNGEQIEFKDPSQEWKTINSWFVKQTNFITVFKLRDIVMPDGEKEALHS